MTKIILLCLLAFASLQAEIKEEVQVPYISYEIKMGKGFDSIQANCLMCHSFGYMINQGPQSKEFWHKKVVKMITHFKAPIDEQAVEDTTNYLFEHYGNGKLK